MKRKINLVGQNTLTVSLPKKWVERNNVKKGDEVEVIEESNTLTLKAGQSKKTKRISLNFAHNYFETTKTQNNVIRTIIGSLYKNGYEDITLKINDPKDINIVQKRINLLMGMEIISTSKDICVIKNVLEANLQEFDSVFRKFIQIIVNKSKEIEEGLRYKQFLASEDIENYKLSLEKLSDFLEHILAKDSTKEQNVLYNQRFIVTNIEKLAREYVHLCIYINSTGIKSVDEEIISYMKDVNLLLEKYMGHYYQFKTADIEHFVDTKNILIFNRGYKLLSKAKSKELPIVHHLMNIVRRVWDCEGPTLSYNILTEKLLGD